MKLNVGNGAIVVVNKTLNPRGSRVLRKRKRVSEREEQALTPQ